MPPLPAKGTQPNVKGVRGQQIVMKGLLYVLLAWTIAAILALIVKGVSAS